MRTRIHTKTIATTIAAALVIAALVAPGTSAGPSKGTPVTIPPSLARLHEPGSTGYVPKTTLVTTTAPTFHSRCRSVLTVAVATSGTVATASRNSTTMA